MFSDNVVWEQLAKVFSLSVMSSYLEKDDACRKDSLVIIIMSLMLFE